MEIDIANNIKAVELLKVELLQSVTDLFGDLAAETDSDLDNRIAGDAADLILMTKLICRRLGLSSEAVKSAMSAKLENEIAAGHILERRFGDLSYILSEIREDAVIDEKR